MAFAKTKIFTIQFLLSLSTLYNLAFCVLILLLYGLLKGKPLALKTSLKHHFLNIQRSYPRTIGWSFETHTASNSPFDDPFLQQQQQQQQHAFLLSTAPGHQQSARHRAGSWACGDEQICWAHCSVSGVPSEAT